MKKLEERREGLVSQRKKKRNLSHLVSDKWF